MDVQFAHKITGILAIFAIITWYNQVGNENILKNMSSVIVLFQTDF